MIFLYDNIVQSATLTASSTHGGYSVDNLKHPSTFRWWRGTAFAGDSIIVSNPYGKTVEWLILNAHNLSDDCSIRVQGNYSNSWDTPAMDLRVQNQYMILSDAYDLVDENDDYIVDENDDVIIGYELVKQFGPSDTQAFKLPTANYPYYRIIFEDNDDRPVRLGGMYLGPAVNAPGMEISQEIGDETTTDTDFSDSGQVYNVTGYEYRTIKVSFSHMDDDKRETVRALYKAVGLSSPFYVIVWPGDLRKEPAMYCVIEKPSAWGRTNSPSFPFKRGMNFREVF